MTAPFHEPDDKQSAAVAVRLVTKEFSTLQAQAALQGVEVKPDPRGFEVRGPFTKPCLIASLEGVNQWLERAPWAVKQQAF